MTTTDGDLYDNDKTDTTPERTRPSNGRLIVKEEVETGRVEWSAS